MKNQLLTILLISITIFSFGQAKISFNQPRHDFGYVSEGTKAKHIFEFTNSGNDTLVISRVQPSCGCTSPNWSKEPVLPGQTGKIEVIYNSKNRLGEFTKSIKVYSNASNETSPLKITGVVASPVKTIAPDSIAKSAKANLNTKDIQIGTIEKLSKHNFKINVTNTGKTPLKIEKIMTGCHCITYTKLNDIPASHTQYIDLVFRANEVRKFDDIVILKVNDPTTPYIQFNLKGEVVNSLRKDNMMQTSPGSGF